MGTIRRFVSDESGVAAIEYGLIVTAISLAVITMVNSAGLHVGATLNLNAVRFEVR